MQTREPQLKLNPMASDPKQVRFAKLVAEAGPPEVYTPWLDPAKDPEFQKALRQGRILTVDRVTVGTKKDSGEVGYAARENAGYLIFPRSIKAYAGKKVIGLNYELLEKPKAPARPPRKEPAQSKTTAPSPKTADRPAAGPKTEKFTAPPKAPPAPPVKALPKPPPPPPPPPRFRVVVRLQASVEIERELEAKNRREAGEMALREIEPGAVDFAAGTLTKRVVRVVKAPGTG